MPKKHRRKRHIRKSLIVVLVLVIACGVLAFQVPKITSEAKLKDLGYSKEAIKCIQKTDYASDIIQNQYYSKYMEQCILNGSLQEEYLPLYAAIKTDRTLTDTDFLLYNRLMDKGYEVDQLQNLFNNLTFIELTPLLVFDYQWDENPYIQDCKNNRDHNNESSFSLSDSYYQLYKLQKEIPSPHDTSVLVNSTYGLTSDFVPDNIVDISTQYAVSGVQLVQECADAFIAFAQASQQAGHYFFATVGYREYAIQEGAYNSFLARMSQSEADKNSIRPGHSEHQTGLAVNVAATYETSVAFSETETYKWMVENCTSYGFIQRYANEKSSITGVKDELEHFRYVGKDLAKKITESHLTYDEYYMLYLADWDEKSCIPSKKILKNIPDYVQ